MPAVSTDEARKAPPRRTGSVRLRLAVVSGVVVLGAALLITTVTGGLVFAPLVALGAGLLAWVVADRALRPVGDLETRYRELAHVEDLRLRLDEPSGDDESAALARTLNAALDQREATARSARAFVGRAASAVRGPLDAVRADVAAAGEADPVDAAGAGQNARRALDELEDTIADLLLLASLRAGERPARAILPWFEVMAEVRPPVDVEFTVEGDLATLVLGARAHLGVMVQHLLDEAAHHARSAVVLRIAAFDDAVVLRVDDDGPPLTDAERERVLAPFADGSTPPRPGGRTGLGLVVVDEIARAHGGTVAVEDSPRGGSRVRVELPALAPGTRLPG